MPSPAGTRALLEAANGPALLVVTTSSAGTSWTVARCGSLVADTAIALYPFEQLRSGDFQLVTMDLRGLTAIDGVGSAVLGALGDRVERLGADLRIQHQADSVAGRVTRMS